MAVPCAKTWSMCRGQTQAPFSACSHLASSSANASYLVIGIVKAYSDLDADQRICVYSVGEFSVASAVLNHVKSPVDGLISAETTVLIGFAPQLT